MYIFYSLKLAIQSIWRERWINLLSVLTIAAGLFMVTLTYFSVYNMDIATKKLPEKFSMMLYLKNDISEQDKNSIISLLKKNNFVERIRFISKDKALQELKGVLKNADYVLEGINENPLPASIEVKIKQEFVSVENVKKLASDVKKLNGIDEIEYGEQFLNSIHSIKAGAQTLGLLLISLMSTGIVFVCYSTVKIMFYRRKEEIETFKLLGATRGFIRAPFVIEGGILGICGGLVSMLGAIGLYYALFYRLAVVMPIFKIIVFPVEVFTMLPLTGLILGIGGAIIALGRIRFS
jgi:cell division transport system permease protein